MIESEKIVNLGDAQILYNDARDKAKAGLATKANAIAIQDNTAAQIKTLSDGADGMPMGLTVKIDPVQDLHGFDNPIPPGLSDNIVNEQSPNWVERKFINDTGAVGSDNDYRYINEFIPVSPNTAYTFQMNKTATTSCGASMPEYDENQEFIIRKGLVAATATSGTKTATFTTGETTHYIKLSLPIGSNRVMIAEGSVVPDYAPYANICPITGFTGCNLSVTNRNLVDISLANWETYFLINENGGRVYNSSYKTTRYYYKVNGAGKVTWSFNSSSASGASCVLIMYDSRKNFLGRVLPGGSVASGFNEFTGDLFEGTAYVRFNAPRTTTLSDFQLEYAQIATEYEPVTTYDIGFPNDAGTVYGGTLTVNKDGTGVLTVNRAVETIPEIEDYDGTVTGTTFNYCNISTTNNVVKTVDKVNVISDVLKGVTYNDRLNEPFTCITLSNLNRVRITVSGDFSVSQFNSEIAGQHLVYFIETPVTYNLTASQVGQILSLKGDNNIWANTGNILSVDYSADTKTYIDNLFASITNATGVSF